jgi:hypothetical protein
MRNFLKAGCLTVMLSVFSITYSWAQCTWSDIGMDGSTGYISATSIPYQTMGLTSGSFTGLGSSWTVYSTPHINITLSVQVQIDEDKSACIYFIGFDYNTNSKVFLEAIHIATGTSWGGALIDLIQYNYQNYYV